jgi:hypothetical protein
MIEHQEIPKSDLDKFEFETVLHRDEHDRRFWSIGIGEKRYLLGWRSDLIDPKICRIDQANLLAIGVDLNFFIIDLKTNKLALEQSLDSFFLTFYLQDDVLIAVSELELFLIDVLSLETRIVSLPEIFKDLSFDGPAILVTCLDGQATRIAL